MSGDLDSSSASDYSLVRLRNGACSLHAHSYAETMHPGIGPEAEAQALYVEQTGLVRRLETHTGDFVVWDVGLGAAANALAVIRAAAGMPSKPRLRVLSFDNTDAPIRFAMQHASDLPHLASHREPLNELLRTGGVEFAGDRIYWTLHLGDFPVLQAQPSAATWPKPHLILFDPFSPSKNPAMWTLPLFERLSALLDPARPCLIPTYSRSTMLRVTWLLSGLFVGVGRATGTKEETTVAANRIEWIDQPLDARWLERARRSDSAEPLHEPVYRKARLTPGSWERLRAHPQFQRLTD